MSRLRIYPSKENTIASGIYSIYNSSQNPVTDLWYGGGVNNGIDFRHSVSRHLLKFDLDGLRAKIANVDINTGLTVTYRLRMKNAVPSNKTLEKEMEFNKMQKSIASSFDLLAFPVDKAWDEGRGYDMLKQKTLVNLDAEHRITGYSNWHSATSTEDWTEDGVFTDPTASTVNYVYQHFDIGSEDINMDITSMVNDWLSGGSENHGLCISYARNHEIESGETRFMSSFFTKHTNYSYKPYLEVIFDGQYIKDDRMQVSNNRPSRLFLYTFSGNSAANYASASTVDIKTNSGSVVISDLVPTQLERGIYYVDVLMTGTTRGEKFKDVWKGISFDPTYDQQDITQTFSIKDNYYTSDPPSVNEYSIDVYGLDNGAKLYADEIIRVHCDLRVNYSLEQPRSSYNLKYRVVMNHEEEVIPWTNVNQAIINNKKSNYFLLDTSWLLHNQTYDVHFKIEELGTSRVLPVRTSFQVLRPF